MKQNLGNLWTSNLSLKQKILRAPLRLIPSSTRIKVKSGINKGFVWVTGSANHGCWLGIYEREKQNMLQKALRPGMVAWDVGANVGFYTLAFSRSVGIAGQVVAFEPMCINMHYLINHLNINRCTNVDVVQAAVFSENALISFSHNQTSHIGKIEISSSYKIPSISLDSYFKMSGGRMPDLLKIDVEGSEADVLRGAAHLLEKGSPEIWVALHGQAATEACSSFLRSKRYKLYRIDGSQLNGSIDTDEIIARRDSA